MQRTIQQAREVRAQRREGRKHDERMSHTLGFGAEVMCIAPFILGVVVGVFAGFAWPVREVDGSTMSPRIEESFNIGPLMAFGFAGLCVTMLSWWLMLLLDAVRESNRSG